MIEVVPIQNAAHGANLCGIDLNKTITPSLMKTLTDALYEHRVIIIKDQKLTKARYLEFGRLWGTPIPHVLDHMRMPGYPELLAVGNTKKKDSSSDIRNGAALWHTDQSYERQPASATMLYSILVPSIGGQTKLADMSAAYDAKTKRLLWRISVRGLPLIYKNSGKAPKTDGSN